MGYSTTAIDPQRALAIMKAQKMQPVEWAHSVSGSTPPRLAAIAKNVQHADQTDHEPAKIILYLGPDENEFIQYDATAQEESLMADSPVRKILEAYHASQVAKIHTVKESEAFDHADDLDRMDQVFTTVLKRMGLSSPEVQSLVTSVGDIVRARMDGSLDKMDLLRIERYIANLVGKLSS